MANVQERSVGERNGLAPLLEPFSVEVRPDRDRVIVVPHGELDMATVGQVAATIDELANRGFDAIVLDLRTTSFIDSSGVHLALQQTARRDARVTLIDGTQRVSRVFDVAGVRHLLPFETAQ